EQVDHRDAAVHREPAAGRGRREVRRPDHTICAGEVRPEALLAPDPVPERDHVGAGGQDPLRDLRGDAAAVGSLLPVDDREVGPELLAQRPELRLDGPAARRPEHVRDEEDPQRPWRVAAGWTSSSTWLPSSFVYCASACFSTPDMSSTCPSFEPDAVTA